MTHEVLNGIDNRAELERCLKGKRLGLVTNPSGVDRECHPVADLLNEHFQVTAFFGPEHGIRGDLQNGVQVEDCPDRVTGKPVFALHGKNKRLTEERLYGIDTMVYDIQDVGGRAYSFLTTLAMLMEDCIRFDRELVVLDRINPLGGRCNEGVMAEERFDRWWGYGVPMRFSLTMGEYARMVNARYYQNQCRLQVVPCLNWNRDMMFPDTGFFWCNPSPNLPNFPSALIYAGSVIFGQTNISEARGTTRPYEMYGAPFADGHALAEALNRHHLPGVFFRPCAFRAEYNAFQKYVGTTCSGIMLFITEPHTFNSFETAMWMLEEFRENCPDFKIPFANDACTEQIFDSVLGNSDWRTGACTTEEFIRRGRRDSQDFARCSREYLLYD